MNEQEFEKLLVKMEVFWTLHSDEIIEAIKIRNNILTEEEFFEYLDEHIGADDGNFR